MSVPLEEGPAFLDVPLKSGDNPTDLSGLHKDKFCVSLDGGVPLCDRNFTRPLCEVGRGDAIAAGVTGDEKLRSIEVRSSPHPLALEVIGNLTGHVEVGRGVFK